jgi:hypothetical protein
MAVARPDLWKFVREKYLKSALISSFWFALASCGALAADAVPPCAGVADVRSKSRQTFEGKTLMTNLLALEAKGEASFHPIYAPPATQCLFEKFDVSGNGVEAIHSAHEVGVATLHWRFSSAGAEPRTVLVIYDGVASLLAKKEVFFVIEERQGQIAYYAMFREQPSYAALKPLVTAILDGSAQPLAAVRWPAGAKEPVIEAYDTKRIK